MPTCDTNELCIMAACTNPCVRTLKTSSRVWLWFSLLAHNAFRKSAVGAIRMDVPCVICLELFVLLTNPCENHFLRQRRRESSQSQVAFCTTSTSQILVVRCLHDLWVFPLTRLGLPQRNKIKNYSPTQNQTIQDRPSWRESSLGDVLLPSRSNTSNAKM